MNLSSFLDQLAKKIGPDSLRGAIVFLSLDRDIDRFIQLAMGLGPYHPGKASPWSHTILLADAYGDETTPILDCTIRTPAGAIAWNESLADVLKTGISKSGGIYDGKVSDYNDPRVKAFGVKVRRDLQEDQRARIVAAGKALQKQGYHYDIPGLLRELALLTTGIPIPAGYKLLFCSAFCQASYRNALGEGGNYQPGVKTEDSTPDDLWYSDLGSRFLPPGSKPLDGFPVAGLNPPDDPPWI